MLVITLLPKKYTNSEEDYTYVTSIKNKRFSFIYNGILTLFFSFVIILVRAFSFRLNEFFWDEEIVEIILTVVLSAALFYPVIKLVKKNLNNSDMPLNILPREFAIKILPDYFLIIGLVYFLLGEFESMLFSIDLLEIINKNGFLEKWSSGTLFIPIIMIISFILFNVSFKIIVGKKIKK